MFASTSFATAALALALLALLLVVAGWDVLRRARAKIEEAKKHAGRETKEGSETHDADAQPFSTLGPVVSEFAHSGAVRTRHPILLVHGYFGFDVIGLSALRREYFRGVKKALQALGHEVFVARVSAAAGIELRAAQLAEQIKSIPAPRVNVIAHSMGGLDARLAIASHGLGERVASLITIGTPHHGTPLSDMASALGEWRSLRRSLGALGVHVDGLYDVSTQRMREFNREVPDCPDVMYGSVVGAVNLDAGGVHALLATCHRYLLRRAGPNDGVVPATSQLWGEPLDELDADHWAQVGWFSRFDVQTFYAQLAERLAYRGL
jgi:triacylglycerol lipase